MQEAPAYHNDFVDYILQYMNSDDKNVTVNFRKPFIKNSLKYVYPLFIFLHALIVIMGSSGNIAMLTVIVRRRLYRNPTFFFLVNMALSDIIKAAIVLPMTLANLLIQNWIFGSFLCFFLPMMHSFPTHASIITHLMIAIDRYRFIVHPMKSRVPAGLCTIAVWVVAVCVVLPYAVYIKFIDLGTLLGPNFDGVGICWVNQERHIEEYIRAMFVTMYCLPLAIIAFLYVRVSAELKANETPEASIQIDDTIQSATTSETSYATRITYANSDNDGIRMSTPDGAEINHVPSRNFQTAERHLASSVLQQQDDEDIDMRKEARTQKYMITMVVLFAMCWCPVNILILVTHFVYENDDNSGHFDITYLTFTFFGFVSTCINPVLFASWNMSERTKDRLKGYFRFSNRRRGSAHSTVSRTTEIYGPSNTQQPKESTATNNSKSYV